MIHKLFDQFDVPEMQPLSGMDSTFLYAETETSPMHVGSVAIIEGSLDYKTFKKSIASRIHQVPKLRKRLVQVPFSIDHPYWVDDPAFNIDLHLTHVALPKPGDWKQLRRLASKIFSQHLDKNRPLWSFVFVEGLDNLSQVKPGSVAVISKIHHVVIDGAAGAGILGVLFDLSPKTKAIPEPREYNPEPLPNEASVLLKSTASFAKKPLKFPKLISQALSATVKAGFLTRAQHLDLPTAPFTAPRTPINGIISAERKWNTTILELDRVKKLKSIMGTTLNDIILTICAGALRKYLLTKNKLPAEPLVAMVPVSTRADSEPKDGNQLSAMLVQLATDKEDPLERLEAIYDNTIKSKTYQGAIGAKTLSNFAEAVPFGIANQAARFYSRYNLAKLHKPAFNVVITNVPGPMMPIYLQGNKLHSIMGMAPIIDGMGLIITVLSYNGSITISPTSDSKSMPDLTEFSRMMLDSANELEEHVLQHAKKPKKKNTLKVSNRSVKSPTEDFFTFIRAYLKNNPGFITKPVGNFLFEIKGSTSPDWQLKLSEAPGSVRKGKSKNHDVLVRIEEKHLLKIASKKLDLMTAFIQGRIKMEGDQKIAMKLASILKQLPGYK